MSVIKGVNHRVIEINRPESAYFERAVLYLRPEVSDAVLPAAQLAAEHFLGEEHPRKRRPRLRSWGWFALGMAASAGAAGVLVLLR